MLFDRRAIIGLVLLSSKAQGNHLSLSKFQGIWHSDLDSHPYEDALASYDNEQSFVVQEIQSMGEINVSELSNYSVGTMVCNSEQVSMTILIVAYTSEVCLIRLFYGSIKYITGSFRI